jgi:hypothetical protein
VLLILGSRWQGQYLEQRAVKGDQILMEQPIARINIPIKIHLQQILELAPVVLAGN